MEKFKLHYLVWLLGLIVIFQVIWVQLRLRNLKRLSPGYLFSQQQLKADKNLKNVPEPKIKQELALGGRIWIEPNSLL